MLNQVVIMGRMTRNPELHYTQSQTPATSFTIAVDRDYSNGGDGDRKTDFIDVVAWRATAEFAARCFTKGNMVVVTGRLQIRDWTDREGVKHRGAEIAADKVYFGGTKQKTEANQENAPVASASSEFSGEDYKDPLDTLFSGVHPDT